MSDVLKEIIKKAAAGEIGRADARAAFEAIMSGDATPAQIGGFLMALAVRGETVDQYAAAAEVMRAKASRVAGGEDAIDVVGTGGDGKGTLNISTAAAFVVAGAGVKVAKHGNKALTSKSGTADALSAFGVEVMVKPDVAERALAEAGVCFMMAPMHHPAMRFVGPARGELGARTIFNILGPLTNPAGARRQLTGAFSPDLLRPMAETLRALGSEAAWLVHGSDGTDELSIAGPSKVVALKAGEIEEYEIAPADAGLPEHPFEAIKGGDAAHNAAALARLLREGEAGAYRDAVTLNAAAALVIAGVATDLKDGAAKAAASIDSRAALRKIEALARITTAA